MPRLSQSRSSTVLAVVSLVGALVGLTAATPAQARDHDDVNRFRVARLVSDQPGKAQTTDPNLVNAWGLAFSPTSPLWVSNNGTSTSTLYTGATSPSTSITQVPLVVKIPAGGAPTGVVFNPTNGFALGSGGKTGPALFIFAAETGSITAWNSSGDPTRAVKVAHVRNAVFKGLAMVSMDDKPYLLATDFHHGRVDVFDSTFHRVSMPRAFGSHRIPRGYAPFNVADLDGRVYVTYAKQDSARHDDVAGRGHGFLSVFGSRGHFLRTLVRRGPLDSPWGLAVAPRGFGGLAGRLLVGNFGNGRIHVVDRGTGRVVATLRNGSGRPVVIDGLWALLPGNGVSGSTSDVWFSAGPDGESHGLLGMLHARH
jgi:uncharacterized protein (TIGR03118 family)